MLRTGAPRAVLRSLQASSAQSLRASANASANKQWSSRLCTLASKRPQTLSNAAKKPIATVLLRQVTNTSWDKIDKKHEQEVAQQKLKPTPETVSTTSSIHPVIGEVAAKDPEVDTDMMEGIRQDLKTVKDTFSLRDVPFQAYTIGLAGVLPYMATSLSTVYCAWEINHASEAGRGFLMSADTAREVLHILEPIQVGYGAVILSFLGAIHWGLEWAGHGGYQGYKRYAIGVVAPAVAWPTLLLSTEYALITQFMAFNFLYYADARATVRGWTPPWYGTYRFVLTFIVGASIVISLIGRGEIVDEKTGTLPSPLQRMRNLQDSAPEALAIEEHARTDKIVAEEEAAANEKSNNSEGSEGSQSSEDSEQSEDSNEGEKLEDSGDDEKSEGSGDDKKSADSDTKDSK